MTQLTNSATNTSHAAGSRIVYLDYLRIFACLLVILQHSPIPGNGAPSFIMTGISFFTAPCIGLFFMVSGALLLNEDLSMVDFYRRRLPKVVVPTLVWTFIYITINLLDGTSRFDELPVILSSIPFSAQGHPILWFMYTLVGLYLITPVLSKWLKTATKKEVSTILLLWLLTTLFPVFCGIFSINQGTTGLYYYLSGYAGYYLLGYFINYYSVRSSFSFSFICIVIPIIICGMAIYWIPSIDFYSVFWHLSFFVVAMCVGWFLLFMKINFKYSKLSASLSALTFGVYLCHILVMRYFLWHLQFILCLPWYWQISVVSIITYLVSILLSLLFAYFPHGKYLVGIHLD